MSAGRPRIRPLSLSPGRRATATDKRSCRSQGCRSRAGMEWDQTKGSCDQTVIMRAFSLSEGEQLPLQVKTPLSVGGAPYQLGRCLGRGSLGWVGGMRTVVGDPDNRGPCVVSWEAGLGWPGPLGRPSTGGEPYVRLLTVRWGRTQPGFREPREFRVWL